MTTLIAAVFVFFLVVLIHEFGHFITAKIVGIKVHEFSIGMGPRLVKKGKGETEYSIRAIPIGGYVKMEGEDEKSDDERSFNKRPVLARIAVIAAGPIMNFMLAVILYTIITLIIGSNTTIISEIDKNYPEYKAGLRIGDKIVKVNERDINTWDEYINEIEHSKGKDVKITVVRNNQQLQYYVKPAVQKFIGIAPKIEDSTPTTTISMVDNMLPAYKAGIRSGDKIIRINDKDINNWDQIKEEINNSDDNEEIEVTVLRNGEKKVFKVKPINQVVIGFTTQVKRSLGFSIKMGFEKTIFYLSLMVKFLMNLIKGNVSSAEIAGPVGVINLVGQAAKLGFIPLLSLAGFISINLGFFNLLPIPALDGSRIMFLIIELFRGKSIDPEKEGFIHFIGFVLLILLLIFITYKDILKFNVF